MLKSPMSPRKSVFGKMNKDAWIISTGIRKRSSDGLTTEIDLELMEIKKFWKSLKKEFTVSYP